MQAWEYEPIQSTARRGCDNDWGITDNLIHMLPHFKHPTIVHPFQDFRAKTGFALIPYQQPIKYLRLNIPPIVFVQDENVAWVSPVNDSTLKCHRGDEMNPFAVLDEASPALHKLAIGFLVVSTHPTIR